MPNFEVLLYYLFTPIDDPVRLAEEQLELCRALDLLGRIIVAEEGINGTVSGTAEDCAKYRDAMHADPRFSSMVFKIDPHEGHAFKRLSVKARKEIVTLHAELETPVHERTGTYLSPAEFREMLDNPEILLIDGRNAYEYDLGHFRGAIRPPVDVFKDTPEWLDQIDLPKDKPIVTYCTGGIRCEKLTALLLQEGFENVFQLDGGIVSYGKDPATQGELFDGQCFVFDERITVPVNSTETAQIVGKCFHCGVPTENYVNCADVVCNRLYLCCEDCEIATERCCSEACRLSENKREKGQKLRPVPVQGPASKPRQRGERARFVGKQSESAATT